MPKLKRKDRGVPITIYLPLDLFEKVTQKVEKENRSFSSIIREALEEAFKEELKTETETEQEVSLGVGQLQF